MLDDLIKELNELKEYKKKYECALKDKQSMSDLLYKFMIQEYQNFSYEQRCEMYKEECCKCCMYRDYCLQEDLPDNILKPIPSESGWIQRRTGCERFKWSQYSVTKLKFQYKGSKDALFKFK